MRYVLPILTACALLLVGLTWIGPQYASRFGYPSGSAASATGSPTPVGTSGSASGTDDNLSPATVHEIETITGATDQHSLIGRRVDLDLKAGDVATQTAFWVGPKDNRVLVVLARDVRTQEQRQLGQVATTGITPVQTGKPVRIAGTIEAIPPPESRYSWGVEDSVRTSLRDQQIYIRATSVTPE